MELLGPSLYQLLENNRKNRQIGLSFTMIQDALRSILEALDTFHSVGLVHLDVKPENILQSLNDHSKYKLVDFGTCTSSNPSMSIYVQSRFYRSPEVAMRQLYSPKSDIWSLGCVAAELFFGVPLFPAKSELHLLYQIGQMIGPYPDELRGKFRQSGQLFLKDGTMKSAQRLINENGLPANFFDSHFRFQTLDENFHNFSPHEDGSKETDPNKERVLETFLDLLHKMLVLSPENRISAKNALQHPFFFIEFPV